MKRWLTSITAWLARRPRWVRWSLKAAVIPGALGMLPAGYFLLAWILGAIPVNRDFAETPDGVEVFVLSNGVHTDLVLPLTHEVMDWRPWFPAAHFGTLGPGLDHLAIGWGDRGFYLNVPTWDDLTFGLAFNAMFLRGPSVMHVTLLGRPEPATLCRRVRVSREQYRRLTEFVRRQFQVGEQGRPIRVAAPGYEETDAFYEARGSYSCIQTCNAWTGDALRHAGIRTGVWTPFHGFVLRHLPE